MLHMTIRASHLTKICRKNHFPPRNVTRICDTIHHNMCVAEYVDLASTEITMISNPFDLGTLDFCILVDSWTTDNHYQRERDYSRNNLE